MEHTNTLCGQNAENLYIETGVTLDIKGLSCRLNDKLNVMYSQCNRSDRKSINKPHICLSRSGSLLRIQHFGI
jgi:hypothetical protein